MSKFANNRVRKMKAYNPPIDGRSKFNGLLLDFNERTVPVGAKVINALNDFVNDSSLQTYPEYFDLNDKIADYAGIKSDQVMIVNGSDQGIDVIFRTFTSFGDRVQISKDTFAMFAQCALMNGNDVVYDFDEDVKLIVICNPNNPTGEILSIEEVERILKKAKNSIVYVDEAYAEYSKISVVSLIDKYPNLIVSRTFSKAWGLASLRIGYVIASKENIIEMLKVRGPYDVNMAAFYAVNAALSDPSYMTKYVDEVMSVSKPIVERFFDENGIEYVKSLSNFVLFKPDNASFVFSELKKNGILTRLRDDRIRVTIGTESQMRKFTDVYGRILGLQNSRKSQKSRKPQNPQKIQKKCAFIDRDGTLIVEPDDGGQVKECVILPGTIEGLKKLKKEGFNLIMVTNQDGVGTDVFPYEIFDSVQNKLLTALRMESVDFDEIFVCPHFESDMCECRKPKIGLLKDYLERNDIDFGKSLMFGDRDTDESFAKNLGVKFVRIKKNNKFLYET